MLDEFGETLDGAIIMPIDVPLGSVLFLRSMITMANLSGQSKTFIVPRCDGRDGHPVYVSKHFFGELKKSAHHGGMRIVLTRNACYRRTLFWPDSRIVLNLNSAFELKEFQNRL